MVGSTGTSRSRRQSGRNGKHKHPDREDKHGQSIGRLDARRARPQRDKLPPSRRTLRPLSCISAFAWRNQSPSEPASTRARLRRPFCLSWPRNGPRNGRDKLGEAVGQLHAVCCRLCAVLHFAGPKCAPETAYCTVHSANSALHTVSAARLCVLRQIRAAQWASIGRNCRPTHCVLVIQYCTIRRRRLSPVGPNLTPARNKLAPRSRHLAHRNAWKQCGKAKRPNGGSDVAPVAIIWAKPRLRWRRYNWRKLEIGIMSSRRQRATLLQLPIGQSQ